MTDSIRVPLGDLRALAEKATPGPWRQGYREGKYVYTGVDDFLTGPIRSENAAYIAAVSPDVTLALLDALDAATARALAAEEALRKVIAADNDAESGELGADRRWDEAMEGARLIVLAANRTASGDEG